MRYLRLKARREAKKVIVALAADLIRAAYFILLCGTPYPDLSGSIFDRLDTTKATAEPIRRLEVLGSTSPSLQPQDPTRTHLLILS